MPEQNNPFVPNDGHDQIAESESLLEELKRMVEGASAADTPADAAATDIPVADVPVADGFVAPQPDYAAADAQPEVQPVEGVFETYVPGTPVDYEQTAPADQPVEGVLETYVPGGTTQFDQPVDQPVVQFGDQPAVIDQPVDQFTDQPADTTDTYTSDYRGSAVQAVYDNAMSADTTDTAAESDTTNSDDPAHKADTPKKKGKGGLIVGIILAALALAGLAFASTQFSACSSDEGQIKSSVSKAMDELAHPSGQAKAELAEGIAEGFQVTAGFDLKELGITPEEYTNWILGDMTYNITETDYDADEGTASAKVSVNARDINVFNTRFAAEIDAMSKEDLSKVNTKEDLYARIGEAMRAAMSTTGTTESLVTFSLSKTEDGWVVNDESKETCFAQILAGTNQTYATQSASSPAAASQATVSSSSSEAADATSSSAKAA